jgi:uncharacterized membrane protein
MPLRVTQAFPDRVLLLAIVALHVLPPSGFALIHGSRVYGLRGVCVFALLGAIIGNRFENVGVLTGFPFGHYHSRITWLRVFTLPLLAAFIMVAWDLTIALRSIFVMGAFALTAWFRSREIGGLHQFLC